MPRIPSAKPSVGPDIHPNPPVRRYADVVRCLVHFAERVRVGRAHQIVAHVARGGWEISKSYAESVLKSEPTEVAPVPTQTTNRMPLNGRFVGHVFILDSHEVKSFLGFRKFFVTGIMDAFSQAPLGLHASEHPPTSKTSALLLKQVVAAWGKPRYVAKQAVPPPRARPGIDRGPPPMRVAWLDPVSRQFPFFQPA